MKDWIEVLDGFIKMSKQNILRDAGKISAKLAKEKAEKEYELYRQKSDMELTEVETHFLKAIETAENKLKKIDDLT